jgi:hypothetical protein
MNNRRGSAPLVFNALTLMNSGFDRVALQVDKSFRACWRGYCQVRRWVAIRITDRQM